jgi:DNA-binding response OmpR family regulator
MKINANVATNSATAALPVLSTTASSFLRFVRTRPTIAGLVDGLNAEAAVDRMRRVRVLLVSPDANARDLMRVSVGSIERRLGEPVSFLEAVDGEQGARTGLRERPDAVVADEIASRAGAFSLAKDLRGASDPYLGPIVILLERKHDAWLARWSGANAWFVRPVDPFELADRLVELIGNDRDQPQNQPKDQRETV